MCGEANFRTIKPNQDISSFKKKKEKKRKREKREKEKYLEGFVIRS